MARSAAGKKVPRARQEAMQETREALLRAGIELFSTQGLDGPSLDAICDRAGYTRGAFYVHFRDREDFLDAVMERVGGRFLDAVLGPSRENGGGEVENEGLGPVVARFLAAVRGGDYPLMRRHSVRPHQLLEACARSPKIRARYTRLVGDAIARLESGVRHSQQHRVVRRDVEPDELALLLMCVVVGAQTLMDLGIEVDVMRGGAAMLRLLGA